MVFRLREKNKELARINMVRMVFRLREKKKELARINMAKYGLQTEGEEQGASLDQHSKVWSSD